EPAAEVGFGCEEGGLHCAQESSTRHRKRRNALRNPALSSASHIRPLTNTDLNNLGSVQTSGPATAERDAASWSSWCTKGIVQRPVGTGPNCLIPCDSSPRNASFVLPKIQQYKLPAMRVVRSF